MLSTWAVILGTHEIWGNECDDYDALFCHYWFPQLQSLSCHGVEKRPVKQELRCDEC